MPLTNPATINISAGTSSAFLSAITFSNSNGVSFGLNGSTLTGSHNALTNSSAFVAASAAFAGTSASGTIASNGISVSIGPYITTADLSQNSSKYVQAWELTGNTSGTTSSLQGTKLYFQGGNSLTVSGSSNSIVFSVGNYITTADLSQNSSKYVQNWKLTGNTSGTTSSAQGTDLWFQGGNNITVSGSSNTIVISAGAGGGGIMAQIGGNTTGTTALVSTGTLTLAGGNNITLSQNGNAITISAANQTNQSAIKAFGASNTGNTAGNTGVSTGIDWVMAGTNNITISESTAGGGPNTLWVSAPTITNLTDSFGVSLSSNSNTITVGLSLISAFKPFPDVVAPVTNSTLGQSSLFFYPLDIPWPVSGSRLNMYLSVGTSVTGVNSSGAGSIGLGYGIYTRGTGTASDRISQLTTYSLSLLSMTYSSNSRLAITHYIGLSNATSHSTSQMASSATNASNYLANSIGGFRAVALPLNLTMTAGRYWVGISVQSTTVNSTIFSAAISVLQQTVSNAIAYRPFGTSSAASNASVYGTLPGLGTYSAQSAAWPASIGLTNSDIRLPISATIPYFDFSGIGTSTNML